MRCPACRQPMLTIEVEGIELDYCGEDLGVWFDEGEIEALFQSTMPVLAPHEDAPKGKRRCPRCHGKMLLVRPLPDLELDLCPHGDGVWFDAGEVKRLADGLKVAAPSAGLVQFEKIFSHVSRMIGGTP
jgi:Zn-finger nucleic acid-binding protein